MLQAIRKYAIDPFKEGDTVGEDTDEQGLEEEVSHSPDGGLRVHIPQQGLFEGFSDGDVAPILDNSPEPVQPSRTKSYKALDYEFRIHSDRNYF